MTGLDHYLAAEQMLEQARDNDLLGESVAVPLGYAQTHALLALAAATMLTAPSPLRQHWIATVAWLDHIAPRGLSPLSPDDVTPDQHPGDR